MERGCLFVLDPVCQVAEEAVDGSSAPKTPPTCIPVMALPLHMVLSELTFLSPFSVKWTERWYQSPGVI